MAKSTDLKRLLEYVRAGAPQVGMFSVLDESIRQAPFKRAPLDQWMGYLQPGRELKREGMSFPLKKAELEAARFPEVPQSFVDLMDESTIDQDRLLSLLYGSRPHFEMDFRPEVRQGQNNLPIPDISNRYRTERWFDEEVPRIFREETEFQEFGRRTGARVNEPSWSDELRLKTESPGSQYEENLTVIPQELKYNQAHFPSDTLSWSRASIHPSINRPSQEFQDLDKLFRGAGLEAAMEKPEKVKRYVDLQGEDQMTPAKVRLIEEIQSDIHQDAREFGSMAPSGKWSSTLMPDVTPERRGYLTPEESREKDQLWSKYKRARITNKTGSEGSKRWIEENPEDWRKLNRLRAKVPDAPFKDTKEYATLELKKQLLTAIEEGEDYLALARGSDQIERYGQYLSGDQQKGLSRAYDETYPKLMQKLGKQYGAEMTEVEIPVRRMREGVQLDSIREIGFETTDDAMDNLEIMIEDGPSDADEAELAMDTYNEILTEIETKSDDLGFTREQMKTLMRANENLERLGQYDPDTIITPDGDSRALYRAFQDDLDELLDIVNESVVSEEFSKGFSKTFPALKLTPEVRERVKRVGVPLFMATGVMTAGEEELSDAWDELNQTMPGEI